MRGQSHFSINAAVVAGIAAGFLGLAEPARTQGLLDALFGGFRSQPAVRPPPPSPAPPAYGAPGDFASGDPSVRSEGGRGGTTWCVRLCDGRYFPLSRNAGGQQASAGQICAAMCPYASTQIFYGGNPEHAVGADGTRYASLPSALLYRDRLISDCTCNGKDSAGLVPLDVQTDPTLRPGDAVAGNAGMTVFAGSRHWPYQTGDFTPVSDYPRLAAEMRQTLEAMKVSANPQAASTALAEMPPPPPQQPPRPVEVEPQTRRSPSPVSSRPHIFDPAGGF